MDSLTHLLSGLGLIQNIVTASYSELILLDVRLAPVILTNVLITPLS